MDRWEKVLDEMIITEEEENFKADIYNPNAMRSNFYDDVQCVNENSYRLFRTFNVEAERKRISNFCVCHIKMIGMTKLA